MAVNSLGPNTVTGNSAASSTGFDNLKTEDFVAILLAELQNQNPLEPMDNAKLLDQFNSINTLSTSNRLIETLQSMTLSQSLGSASNLIGQTVTAKVGNGVVEGVVDSAIVQDGRVLLTIGDTQFPLENVTKIQSSESNAD